MLIVKGEVILDLMAQQLPPQLGYWLAVFFLTGFVFGILMAFIVAGLYSRDKRLIEEQAAAAGVSIDLDSRPVVDAEGIEGCGYCIGSIIIIAAGALGISLPIVIPEAAEQIILTIVIIVFGAIFWGLAVGSIPYIRHYRRGFRKALQDAIDNRAESQV